MATKAEILEQLKRGEGILAKAGDHEQIFIIRGHDIDGASVVREWAKLRTRRIILGEKPLNDMEQVKDALHVAAQMETDRFITMQPSAEPLLYRCSTCFANKDFCARLDCPGIPF
jgi:hypothetical protein